MKVLLFGLFSGLMGAFSVAISPLYRVKFRITVLLPAFLLLNLSVHAPAVFRNMEGSVSWNVFMMLHEDAEKNVPVFVIALVLITVGSVSAILWASRRDQL